MQHHRKANPAFYTNTLQQCCMVLGAVVKHNKGIETANGVHLWTVPRRVEGGHVVILQNGDGHVVILDHPPDYCKFFATVTTKPDVGSDPVRG